MRKIGMLMSLLMGLIMSFVLSLVGTLVGGHFTVPAWLMSFGVSFLISLVIGFIVPMNPLYDLITGKLKAAKKFLLANIIDSLISNIIYTPILSASMVLMAWIHIPAEHRPPYIALYAPSLAVTFIVGWIVIFVIQPILLKSLFKKFNLAFPPVPPVQK